MQKIKIRLPATLTDFGPGLQTLGLAISLYTHIEISPRNDDQLILEPFGEGAGQYALAIRHPVLLAMNRIFQQLESAPPGLNIRIQNNIPMHSGLGAEAALMTAGVIAANNLMGNRFTRPQVLELLAQVTQQPDNAITAMLGGLTATYHDSETILVRNLPLTNFKFIIAVPDTKDYQPTPLPERVSSNDAIDNLRRLPLVMEALREGNLKLLAQVIHSPLLRTETQSRIPGFVHVAEVARLAGVLATFTSGGGPAMVFLVERSHDRIAEVIEIAFRNIDLHAKVFVVSADTQGVVMSMMQTSL